MKYPALTTHITLSSGIFNSTRIDEKEENSNEKKILSSLYCSIIKPWSASSMTGAFGWQCSLNVWVSEIKMIKHI